MKQTQMVRALAPFINPEYNNNGEALIFGIKSLIKIAGIDVDALVNQIKQSVPDEIAIAKIIIEKLEEIGFEKPSVLVTFAGAEGSGYRLLVYIVYMRKVEENVIPETIEYMQNSEGEVSVTSSETVSDELIKDKVFNIVFGTIGEFYEDKTNKDDDDTTNGNNS